MHVDNLILAFTCYLSSYIVHMLLDYFSKQFTLTHVLLENSENYHREQNASWADSKKNINVEKQ